MKKLLPLLLFCFLLSSCETAFNEPVSDYRFEVSCSNCVIRIQNGNQVVSYNVFGYQSIPVNHNIPIYGITLYTNYDFDPTYIRFVGSGYRDVIFDDDLYYDDPATYFEFNL
jgi:hypothetical protein